VSFLQLNAPLDSQMLHARNVTLILHLTMDNTFGFAFRLVLSPALILTLSAKFQSLPLVNTSVLFRTRPTLTHLVIPSLAIANVCCSLALTTVAVMDNVTSSLELAPAMAEPVPPLLLDSTRIVAHLPPHQHQHLSLSSPPLPLQLLLLPLFLPASTMVHTVTAMELASLLGALLEVPALAVAIAPLILLLEFNTLELTAQSSFCHLRHQFQPAEISHRTAQLAKFNLPQPELDAIGALDLPQITMPILSTEHVFRLEIAR